MYHPALDCGIGIESFWNSSIVEIEDEIESHNRVMMSEQKERIYSLFLLSSLINERHPMVDKTSCHLTMPWDYYPSLFEEEKKVYEQIQNGNELEEYKEKRKEYAANWNNIRKR